MTEVRNSDSKKLALGAVFLVGLGIICVVGVMTLAHFVSGKFTQLLLTFNSIDAAVVVALITGCISVVTVVIGAILNSYLSYRHKCQEFLRERRERPYRKLVEINFKVLQSSKKGSAYGADEMLTDYMESLC